MPVLRMRLLLLLAVVGAVVWSWFASGVRTFTRPAEVLTFLPGVAVLLFTLRPLKRARHSERDRVRYDRRGVGLWIGLILAATSWEMFQLFSKPRSHHPTISSLLNSLISTHPSRFASYLLWLVLGGLLLREAVVRRE